MVYTVGTDFHKCHTLHVIVRCDIVEGGCVFVFGLFAMAIAQKEFEMASLPVTIVTVFSDRAEVKRLLKASVVKGTNEIIVKKLTRSIDKDSIRVDGRGKATIADVLYQEKAVKKEEKSVEQKIESLKDEGIRLERCEQRLRKLRQTLDDLAGNVGRLAATEKKPEVFSVTITDEHLEGLDSFHNYYDSKATKLDEQIMQVEKKRRNLEEDIRIVREGNQEHHTGKERSVSVILEAEEDGAVEMDISYMVWNASWAPSYDLRLFTKDRNLKVHYYGLVKQKTAEAWNDVKLLLSTATPSVGGRIPEVGTLQASLFRAKKMVVYCSAPASPPSELMKSKKAPKMKKGKKESSDGSSDSKIQAKMMTVPVQVQEAVVSSTFEIARPTTIPPDDADHKVTIAVIDLKPDLEHETVPSKEQLAFMKARIVNTSPYPLLSGPTSVYWDNSFVAKSNLKSVSPQESFSCSLGPDNTVRIEQKPVKKFLDDSGFWWSPVVSMHEQKTVIKNTRTEPIQITVISQIPRSTEEKVKVELVEPQLSKTVQLNPENNLELKMRMDGGETKEIMVKYKVEFPRNEKIVFEEVGLK